MLPTGRQESMCSTVPRFQLSQVYTTPFPFLQNVTPRLQTSPRPFRDLFLWGWLFNIRSELGFVRLNPRSVYLVIRLVSHPMTRDGGAGAAKTLPRLSLLETTLIYPRTKSLALCLPFFLTACVVRYGWLTYFLFIGRGRMTRGVSGRC